MKRAVFTERDSAAGALKGARLYTFVSGMGWDLLDWPAPAVPDYAAFMRQRRILAASDDPLLAASSNDTARLGAVLNKAATCDRLELWFGPALAENLALCLIINEIAARPELAAKTFLAALDVNLAEQKPEWIRDHPVELSPLNNAVRDLAAAAWRAFCSPTPEAWLALVERDTAVLPHLNHAGQRWLEELPDHTTGLSRAQRDWLEQIAAEPKTLMNSFGLLMAFRQPVHGYWRLGRELVDMLNANEPPVAGVFAPAFDLMLHDDKERHLAFCRAIPRLTPFGKALLAGKADYVASNSIDRWWGGTHLKGDQVWRWDAVERSLVAPA